MGPGSSLHPNAQRAWVSACLAPMLGTHPSWGAWCASQSGCRQLVWAHHFHENVSNTPHGSLINFSGPPYKSFNILYLFNTYYFEWNTTQNTILIYLGEITLQPLFSIKGQESWAINTPWILKIQGFEFFFILSWNLHKSTLPCA